MAGVRSNPGTCLQTPSETTCHAWFHYSDDVPVGRGETSEAAYGDLVLDAVSHDIISGTGNERTPWNVAWEDLAR